MTEERKAYMRRYREEHREQILQKNREYKLANKDKISEDNKNYREKNKDKISEYQKQYRVDNKDKLSAYSSEYRVDHRDELLVKNRDYHKKTYKTKNGRAKGLLIGYNARDKERGFDISGNITYDWIVDNVFSGQVCYYCGNANWKDLGVDRIDNTKGHTPDNCVPCCQKCNSSRGNRKTSEEYKKEKGGA